MLSPLESNRLHYDHGVNNGSCCEIGSGGSSRCGLLSPVSVLSVASLFLCLLYSGEIIFSGLDNQLFHNVKGIDKTRRLSMTRPPST